MIIIFTVLPPITYTQEKWRDPHWETCIDHQHLQTLPLYPTFRYSKMLRPQYSVYRCVRLI